MAKYLWAWEVGASDADLSTIPAIQYPEKVVFWDGLTESEAKYFWSEAHLLMSKYSNGAGSQLATRVLGCLEDLYPDWIEKWEDEAIMIAKDGGL